MMAAATFACVISGFESYIASVWRRLVAEFIDIVLISIVLKVIFPSTDYRCDSLSTYLIDLYGALVSLML